MQQLFRYSLLVLLGTTLTKASNDVSPRPLSSSNSPVIEQIGEKRNPLPINIPPVEEYTSPSKAATTHFKHKLKVDATRPDQARTERPASAGSFIPTNNLVSEPTPKTPKPATAMVRKPAGRENNSLNLPDARIYRLSGTLTRAIDTEAPRYSLHLHDMDGKRIAHVDVSQMYVENIRPYLDQKVSIHGELHLEEAVSSSLVIIARTIRIEP
ncbi:MAG: hypothetical protein ACON4O_06505 [Lentimonas sp.]